MPGNESEQRIQVRAFSGVDIETDPAFLPADTLQQAQNLFPQLTYLLQKRNGTTIWTNEVRSTDPLPWLSPRIDTMRWVQTSSGVPVLFFVVTTIGDGVITAKGDRLYSAVGTPVPVVNEVFNFDNGAANGGSPVAGWVSTSGARYGMSVLGGRLYVGNGINPLVVVVIDSVSPGPATVTTTTPIGSFTMAGPNLATLQTLATVGASQGLLPGTYSYRWGYLQTDTIANTSTWLSLSETETVVVTSDMPVVSFMGPTAADLAGATDPTLPDLDATHTAHLFLSPPGYPIEYSRDHGMVDTTTGPPSLVISQLVTTSELTPLRGVAFTGRYLQRHRGRIWLSGDQTNNGQNRSRLYSTNVIVPGLEQQLYNYGDFFPALANSQIGGQDGDDITGLTVSGGGANKDVAFSPLLIFKNAEVHAWFGDLIDDPAATLVQISDVIGCVAPQTIVAASHEGIFWLGADSVYFLGNGFDEPIDVGLPIRPAIRAIPKSRLPFACAVYHRGFYKLAITPPTGQTNTQQWWLDLGPVGSGPDVLKNARWWGPHACTPVSSMTVALLDPAERERLYVGRECSVDETPPVVIVCTADQAGVYTDTASLGAVNPVVSILRTGGLVEDDPFGWKSWAMARIVTLPDRNTPVTVSTFADGGSQTTWPTMNQNEELDGGLPADVVLTESGTGIWDVSLWDVATWGAKKFVEGWSIFGAERIRSHSLEVQLTHADPSGILIRDLEVTYAPIQRRAPGAR